MDRFWYFLSKSWAVLFINLICFRSFTFSCVSIPLVPSNICCNGWVVFVVGTVPDHSSGTGFWAQRVQPLGGVSLDSCRILVDVHVCNRLYKLPGGNFG